MSLAEIDARLTAWLGPTETQQPAEQTTGQKTTRSWIVTGRKPNKKGHPPTTQP